MTSLAASIPPISKDFYEKIMKAFGPLDIVPNVTTMDEIMHHAGTQAVLAFIRAHGHTESIVTGADVSQTVNVRAR